MNDKYPFGLDFYEGNGITSFATLAAWDQNVRFAYFRAGQGSHMDKQDHILAATRETNWSLGFYYVIWHNNVSVSQQIQTIERALLSYYSNGDPGRLSLPLALDYEPVGGQGFPPPAVLWAVYTHFKSKGVPVLVYTNQAGLQVLTSSQKLDLVDWWIAYYINPRDQESNVDVLCDHLQTAYRIPRERVQFVQTIGDGGTYPPDAATDKGADYDRAVSFPLTTPAPPPASIDFKTYEVIPDAGLNVRMAPEGEKVGALVKGSQVYATDQGNGWAQLGGVVSLDYLQPVNQTPTPNPAPSGTFGRVLHDFEYFSNHKPRMLQPHSKLDPGQGYPETVNLVNSHAITVTKNLSWYIFALFAKSAPSMSDADLKKAFTHILGNALAFCNGTGFGDKDTPRINYLTGDNLNTPGAKPVKLDRGRITGGNLVKIIEQNVTIPGGGGTLYHKIATLKSGDSLPDIPRLWETFKATTCTPFPGKVPGTYKCNPFPQLSGADVVMPLITDEGFGYIEAARVAIIQDLNFSPYIV